MVRVTRSHTLPLNELIIIQVVIGIIEQGLIIGVGIVVRLFFRKAADRTCLTPIACCETSVGIVVRATTHVVSRRRSKCGSQQSVRSLRSRLVGVLVDVEKRLATSCSRRKRRCNQYSKKCFHE